MAKPEVGPVWEGDGEEEEEEEDEEEEEEASVVPGTAAAVGRGASL